MRKIINLFRNINRLWVLIFLAICLGLVASWLSSSYLKSKENAIAQEMKVKIAGGKMTDVVVSSQDLPRGATLGPTLVKREILADLVSDDMVLPQDFDRVNGVKTTQPLRAGLPLRTSDFTEKSKTFSDTVSTGMRAITIEVDEINSMAQMVQPGNHVDLMLIVADKADPDGGQEAIVVLQNVKVMATGQSMATPTPAENGSSYSGKPPQTYSNFTFEVSPVDAARIALAQSVGKIRAVLRNAGDKVPAIVKDVNSRKLLSVDFKNEEKRKSALANAKQQIQAQEMMGPRIVPVQYIIGGMGSSMADPNAGASAGAPPRGAPAAPAAQIDPRAAASVQTAVQAAMKATGLPPELMNAGRQ